ncbi:MAG: proteinsorting protein [Verrucomicrobiales bacterium]|nr:proteinsorting protein [Verrucomicrobiales bacterium]
MKSINRLATALGCLIPAALPAATATFDDLFAPPALDAATGLRFTTGAVTSPLYEGVEWDDRVTVVGSQYKVAADAPLFGLPHSGNYFITNESTDGGNGITLNTTLILTSAWFGQNEYYGFGGGATSVTITALAGSTPLGSVTFDLQDQVDGQPEVLAPVDTSVFLTYSGITGYRIDHVAPNEFAHNWVADDFTFVPEPGIMAAVPAAAMLGFAAGRRRRRRQA